jgi:hypothetical protein
MFDKIPSLKDFIIYVIPGLLISYFGLDLLNYYKHSALNTETISESTSLSFIGIIFSFVIGFFFSQLQIILFNTYLNGKFRFMRTINETQKENLEIKKTLTNRIKSEFDIKGDNLENDHLIIFACLNFVKAKANQDSHLYIDRHNNLSTLAISSTLPMVLAVWDISLKITHLKDTSFGITLIFSVFLIPLVKKIALNFKDDYYKNIYRQFLVLSKK